jgi:probable HAF family extracellular repeat protein
MNRLEACSLATLLLSAVSFPALCASAQPADPGRHHRYRIIDTGTLGGPTSSMGFEGARNLNNRGMLISSADTPVPDPNAPNCITLDCFVGHGVKWHHGVLEDLGALTSTATSGAVWISDAGFVSGFSENGLIDPLTGFPEVRATLWRDGAILDLGTFGGNNSAACAVNSRGQVVGGAATPHSDPFTLLGFGMQQSRAFLWQNGAKEDLGTLGGPDAAACLINDRGQVGGLSSLGSNPNPITGTPTVHPFLWESGTMKYLGTIGGTWVFQLNHLNERGELVGSMTTAGDATIHPFLWDGTRLRDLGTLGGDFGNAIWVNDAGSVVGLANTVSGDYHAFFWTKGVMTDLGAAPNDQCSIAYALNDRREIVGASGDCASIVFGVGGGENAVLWEDQKLINLNAFVPSATGIRLTVALNINHRGEIAAQGVSLGGELHAFLLVPCDDEGCNAAD